MLLAFLWPVNHRITLLEGTSSEKMGGFVEIFWE
jgi:hypothetical protein